MSGSGEDLDPPRIAPRQSASRPSASGARRVGASHPEPSRVVGGPPRATASAEPPPVKPPLVHETDSRPAPRTVTGPPAAPTRTARRRKYPAIIAVVLALVLAWPVGLLFWSNGKIQHTTALSGAAGTPGTTYLVVGSDSRADGTVTDGAEGQRSDTILVLHVADNGKAAMISLPRDTYVQIAGYGGNKLNASFAFGGGPLLVQTVEGLTGLTVDHYVEIGMGGVVSIVDAVGGVNLCLDYDVNDELSGLVWTAGCHDVDGTTALAFSRMRYSDPLGDIGRQARQRQVIGAVVRKVATPATVLNPFRQVALIDVGTGALITDTDSGIIDLGRLALAFRSASGVDGVTGSPPIADFDYRPGGVGSTVLLDDARLPLFFQKMQNGELTAEDMRQ